MNWPIYGYSGVPSSEQLINEFLLQAENRYGPRGPAVTFTVENTPPGGAIDVIFNPGRTHGRVRIPAGLQEYDRHGRLAHESIHVLSPADQTDATVLDEGLACLFAFELFEYRPPNGLLFWKYSAAFAVVSFLRLMYPDAISQMRTMGERLVTITEAQIMHTCPAFPRPAVHFLVQRFY
jgi:hypothetical protein